MQRLKTGECELMVAGQLPNAWERLDSYPLFAEDFLLTVNRHHPFALRNAVALSDVVEERLIPRGYCEQRQELQSILAGHGITQRAGDQIASDHDLSLLLEAGIGAAIMPESASTVGRLCRVKIVGLDLRRAVRLYAVAGRRRSAAANALMNLLRAADWSQFSRDRGGERPLEANAAA
jgi:DNA-binding transcriptional LysR family regulator